MTDGTSRWVEQLIQNVFPEVFDVTGATLAPNAGSILINNSDGTLSWTSQTNPFDYQQAVLDRDLTTDPVSPTDGDRYIIAGIGGLWSGFTTNDIVEWDGTEWDNYTPTEGVLVYVLDEDDFFLFDGTSWQIFTSGGVTNINDLGDVVITTVGNLEILQYDTGTSKWINQTFTEADIPTKTYVDGLDHHSIFTPALVTAHSDVTSAGSGIIITSAERTALHPEVTALGASAITTGTFQNAAYTFQNAFNLTGIASTVGLGFLARHTTGGVITYRTFANVRTDLGLVIGTNIQAWDEFLDDLAGLTHSANEIPYMNSATTAALLNFLDEDTMVSNDALGLASQQSVKAYVDGQTHDSNTGVVTTHSDVTSAGSGIIITSAERTALHPEVTALAASAITTGTFQNAAYTFQNAFNLTGIASTVGLGFLARHTTGGVITYRTFTNVRTDLGLVIGTDVLAQQTIGIVNNNLVEIDQVGVADNDYAKFTLNGLEGRSFTEVRTDLGLVIGTNVQAWDEFLDDLAGLTHSANEIPYMNTATTAALLNFLDEDNMVSDDALGLASQQSIKKYVDDSIFTPALVTAHSDVTSAGSGIIITGAERTALHPVVTALAASAITTGTFQNAAYTFQNAFNLTGIASTVGLGFLARHTTGGVITYRTFANTRTDLGLVIGTDVLAQQTIGIANNNLVEIDSADVATDRYARFTATGLDGRTATELRADISFDASAISAVEGNANTWTQQQTFQGFAIIIDNTEPTIRFNESGVSIDEGHWRFIAANEDFFMRSYSDSGATNETFLKVTRTGIAIDTVEFLNGAVSITDTLALSVGTTVNEFSIDGTLVGNSDDAVPTEKAVKTYVDGAGAGNEFLDSVFRIQDDGDATKEIAFQASGIATATTRTITMPNADVTLHDIFSPALVTAHSDVSSAGSGIIITDTERSEIYTVQFYQAIGALGGVHNSSVSSGSPMLGGGILPASDVDGRIIYMFRIPAGMSSSMTINIIWTGSTVDSVTYLGKIGYNNYDIGDTLSTANPPNSVNVSFVSDTVNWKVWGSTRNITSISKEFLIVHIGSRASNSSYIVIKDVYLTET